MSRVDELKNALNQSGFDYSGSEVSCSEEANASEIIKKKISQLKLKNLYYVKKIVSLKKSTTNNSLNQHFMIQRLLESEKSLTFKNASLEDQLREKYIHSTTVPSSSQVQCKPLLLTEQIPSNVFDESENHQLVSDNYFEGIFLKFKNFRHEPQIKTE